MNVDVDEEGPAVDERPNLRRVDAGLLTDLEPAVLIEAARREASALLDAELTIGPETS